jgi:hypothetical protein
MAYTLSQFPARRKDMVCYHAGPLLVQGKFCMVKLAALLPSLTRRAPKYLLVHLTG